MILQGQTADRVQIQTSTKGIVFLASPHGGSHLAQSLNKLSFLIDSPKHLADVLSVGSKALEKLNNEFQVYYDRRREHDNPLRISSFCEMHRTNGVTIVPLRCAKTGLEGEVTFNVEKDHRSICKLTSPDDPVFDLICKEIARITVDIPTRRPSCDLDQACEYF